MVAIHDRACQPQTLFAHPRTHAFDTLDHGSSPARPSQVRDSPAPSGDQMVNRQGNPVLVIGHMDHVTLVARYAVHVHNRDVDVSGHRGRDCIVVADDEDSVNFARP